MSEVEGDEQTSGRLAPILRRVRPLDVAVGVAIGATFALWWWWTRDVYFFYDDWILLRRGETAGDLLRSYNGHLSVTYLLVYRAHVALFGVDEFWVLRTIDLVALVATPALLYLTLRRRTAAVWAAVAALLVLWPHGISYEAAAMNHWAGLALAVVVAWALEERTTRGDLVVAGCLALGFLTVGGTVAVAVAAVASCVLSRARWSRWVAVLVPCAAWYAWYRWDIGSIDLPEQYELSTADTARLVVDGQVAALRTLALDIPVLAVVLGLVGVGLTGWRLWVDRWRGAVVLGTWWVANLAWWVGLATSRGVLAEPDTFRYRYVGAVFLLLSVVPPPRTGDAVDRAARAPWAGAPDRHPGLALAGVVALGVLLVVGNLNANRDEAELMSGFGRASRVTSAPGFADPGVVPADARYGGNLGWSTGADLGRLRDRYGPRLDTESRLDGILVDRGAVKVLATRPAADGRCAPEGPVEVPSGRVVVAAPDGPVTVSVRRFGPDLVEVLEVPAGREVGLLLATEDQAPDPWVVVADGACTRPG